MGRAGNSLALPFIFFIFRRKAMGNGELYNIYDEARGTRKRGADSHGSK